MRLSLLDLPAEGLKFSHQYEAGELELVDREYEVVAEPLVEGRLSRIVEEVRVTGSLKAELEAPCDRCLDPVSLPVESEFDLFYLPRLRSNSLGADGREGQREINSARVSGGRSVDPLHNVKGSSKALNPRRGSNDEAARKGKKGSSSEPPRKLRNEQNEDELELLERDLDFSTYSGNEVDVDELVLEQLELSIPGRILCSESCKGLCPECGINLNHESCSCAENRTASWLRIEGLPGSE